MADESLYAAGVDPTIARLGLNQVHLFVTLLDRGNKIQKGKINELLSQKKNKKYTFLSRIAN